jgi:hypothetical protein
MATGQESSTSAALFYCPRCGGEMFKPAGSQFYWHASSNHRPCSITNIADLPRAALPAQADSPVLRWGQPKPKLS